MRNTCAGEPTSQNLSENCLSFNCPRTSVTVVFVVGKKAVESTSVREGRSTAHYFLRGVGVRGKQCAVFPFKAAAAVVKTAPRVPRAVFNRRVIIPAGLLCLPAGFITEVAVNGAAGGAADNGGTVPWNWSTPAVVGMALMAVPFAGAALVGLGIGVRAVGRNFVDTGKAEEQRRMISG